MRSQKNSQADSQHTRSTLKENTDLMYDVIEKMDSMVRVMDEQDNIVYMNRRMREEFGDLTGCRCYELLRRDCKCFNCVALGCQQTGQTETKDVEFKDKTYRIFASPVNRNGSAGEARYSIEIFYDITEQKKLEEENEAHYRKLKEDIHFAKQVQTRVLPKDGIYWNSIKLASAYEPSEDLSGDLFDVVKIDEQKSLIYIADVSGHGIRSSLLTIFLRQVIRGMKEAAGDLTAVMDQLIGDYNGLHIGNEQYFTILCALYDKKEETVTLINGGHNCLPILVKENGEPEEILVKGLPVCGLLSRSNHQEVKVHAGKGDRLILYTDGIVEAGSPEGKEPFGLKRLLELIRREKGRDGKELAWDMIHEACSFANKKTADDMAAVVVTFLGPGPRLN